MLKRSPRQLIALAVVLAPLFLAFDISLPLGAAGGILYVALVMLGIWFSQPRHVYALAIVGSAFTVIGYFLSSPDDLLWVVVVNRAFALAVIWLTAILIAARKQTEMALRSSMEREALQKSQSALINDRLHSAIESFPDGFVLYDPDDRLIMCNQAFRKMWNDIDDLIKPGVYFHELATAIADRGLAQKDEAVKKQTWVYDRLKHGFEDEFLEIQLANGRWILHHDHRTADGGHAGIRIDITERKLAELKIHGAMEAAEKANEVKSEFLASMSHELRTPLNAVLGFAQLLQFDPNAPLSPAQNAHVENILEGGNHLLELVNEILDLAKIEANRLNLSFEEVSANDIVTDCVGLSLPLADLRNIAIVNQFSSEALALLRTDRLRLKQSLLNLLSNAIRYNKDGGTVTINGQTTTNGFLHLSVTDTGVGIAAEHQRHVFQMFHRLDADPMLAREGTGIGLTVTKLLIERMAGQVGFESEEGVGSTFWIELPLASNEDVMIWADTMRIGVDSIDKDHQTIISLLNRVTHEANDDPDLDRSVDDLIDYTHYHFRREEAVMEACNYPNLEKHRDMHKMLADQVSNLADTWRSERDPELLYRFHKFLRDWLFHHIMLADGDIAHFTKGKEQEIKTALQPFE